MPRHDRHRAGRAHPPKLAATCRSCSPPVTPICPRTSCPTCRGCRNPIARPSWPALLAALDAEPRARSRIAARRRDTRKGSSSTQVARRQVERLSRLTFNGTEARRRGALCPDRCVSLPQPSESDAAMPPRATYRLQFHREFTLRDALALVPYLAGARDQPHLCLADHRGAAGLDPRLRHRQPQPAQSRDRQRGGFRGAGRGAARRTAWGSSSTSCRTTWGSAATTMPGGSTCSNGARPRPTPPISTSTGMPRAPICKGRVLLPVLGDQYGAVLESGEIELRFDPGEGSFSFWYYEHRFPVSPLSYPAILRRRRRARWRRSQRAFASAARLRAGARHASGGGLKRAAGRGRRDARRSPRRSTAAVQSFAGTPGRPASFRPPASAARRAGLSARLLAGRRRRDQLPPLLQHQRPRRAAHRIAGAVRRDPPADLRAGRARRDRRAAHRPHRRAVRPGRLLRARCASALAPSRSTSSSRRSWRATRRCRIGRSTAPPATISSTRCWRCSSIPTAKRR